MALTPEDVVTKQFQHVRFKEGFDPDEVDDFLDEIVVEWRKTIAENEELKAKVAALEAAAEQAGAAAPVVDEDVAAQPDVVDEVPAAEPTAEVVADEPTAEAVAEPAVTAPAADAAAIIELAQRLHDEHVAEGQAQRDQLISDAQAEATRILSEAEEKQREQTARLERERAGLEGRISELQQFEREYRTKLRTYIEGQLRDLDTTATTSGSTPVSSIGL